MQKACKHVGGKIWTLTYIDHKDGTVTIENFESEDNDGYLFSDTLPVLNSIKESEGRIAEEVTVAGVTYAVRNKENIFTYKKPL